MRFKVLELQKNIRYSFIAGTRERADSELRSRIREQIEEAMSALDREPDSYSVSVIRNPGEEPEEGEIPLLGIERDYLIFALLDSGDSGGTFSEREFEEQKSELSRGIIPPPKSRIALVLLHDTTIEIISSQNFSNATVRGIGVDYDRGSRWGGFDPQWKNRF